MKNQYLDLFNLICCLAEFVVFYSALLVSITLGSIPLTNLL
jgi:hypothetical protein